MTPAPTQPEVYQHDADCRVTREFGDCDCVRTAPQLDVASTRKFRWYVTYTYKGPGAVFGDGSAQMITSESWFPIRQAQNWILSDIKAQSVIVKSWRRISERQAEEYSREG